MAGEDEIKSKEEQLLEHQTNNSNNNNKLNNKDQKHKPKHRTRLPAKMIDRSQISIWSILKQFIGKELSKIAMPAAWCEPLSFLQRITENIYYSDLLNKASDPSLATNPCKRLEYIAAYAVTNISSNIDRLSKPFNPLLGETYELIREDLGFKVICEQVSHHPPVSAFHTESTDPNANWKFYGTVNPKIKFWGKSIEVTPKGTLTLELNKFNETYTWQSVTCCVHNIIVGKLWFEYYGTMEITCHQTGYKAVINFKPYSWFNKELHKFDGYIYDNKKNKLKALFGYWTHCFYSCDAQAFDNYTKLNKPLPTVQLDECFNELAKNPSANLNNPSRHNHSESDITSLNSAIVDSSKRKSINNQSINNNSPPNNNNNKNGSADFNLNDDDDSDDNLNSNNNNNNKNNSSDLLEENLIDETQRRLSLKKIDPASTASLPVTSSPHLLDSTEIWRADPRPPYAADYYMFNYFAMTLNEMKDEFEKIIAPTDSRFRTDIKQLELGDLDGASREKTRLEEKQRESRKNLKGEHKPKWFYSGKHPFSNEEVYLFNNKYWQRNYSDCQQLY